MIRTPYTRQRAVTVPDARKQASREACRQPVEVEEEDDEPEAATNRMCRLRQLSL